MFIEKCSRSGLRFRIRPIDFHRRTRSKRRSRTLNNPVDLSVRLTRPMEWDCFRQDAIHWRCWWNLVEELRVKSAEYPGRWHRISCWYSPCFIDGVLRERRGLGWKTMITYVRVQGTCPVSRRVYSASILWQEQRDGRSSFRSRICRSTEKHFLLFISNSLSTQTDEEDREREREIIEK